MLDTVPTRLADLGIVSSFFMSNPGGNLEGRLESLKDLQRDELFQ